MEGPFRVGPIIGLLLLALVAGCGGGGGGGGGQGGSFALTDIKYGRLVESGSSEDVFSPLTTIDVDPITGIPLAGSLAPLDPTIDIRVLVSMGLRADYLPRVVPRNGVLVLQFNDLVDPASVRGDVLNADGTIQQHGNVRVRFQKQSGQPLKGVEVELTVHGREVWVDPVTDTQVGFPASPVDFGPNGSPRADATGYLRLTLDPTSPILSMSGAALSSRADGLGDEDTPIGFNPGNEFLDFITQNNLVPTNENFNGFLPDVNEPRIVREFKFETRLTAPDTAGNSSVTFASANFSVIANNGQGEWAGKQLVARPGKADEERHIITTNDSQRVNLATPFEKRPSSGDEVELIRAEFFEPDPTDPIDPDRFDPNNPQNADNSQLLRFVEVREIDAAANPIGPVLSLRDNLPAYSQLSVRFNEPIDRRSVGPWESFRVALNPDGGTNDEKMTRVVINQTQDVVTIQPVREDPLNGTLEVVGWGPGLQALQLILTTVPSTGYLQENLSNQDLTTFLDSGVRGITDLGGRPLAFPNSGFDPNDPAIRYSEPFFADEALSSQATPPPSPDVGVIVHRFLGRPRTGIDPATGNAGVQFQDQNNFYTPIADVNLQVNGFLSPPPVQFLTKVHDDFFPPPDGQFGAFPFGTSFPLASFFATTDAPPWEHNGARFQQVWRDVDASPGRDSLQGTLLDLYRVSWAPIGGNVSADVYEDISVHVGHAYVRPFTLQNGAGAVQPRFGLNDLFDYQSYFDQAVNGGVCPAPNALDGGPNHYDKDYVTVVPPGTTYSIHQDNLFSPPFDTNAFHPWPEFTTRFQYNNGGYPDWHRAQRTYLNSRANGTPWKNTRRNEDGDSLMLEVRVRPQLAPISRANGFVFSPGILISRFPYFRVFSVGTRGAAMNPDDPTGDAMARCATPTPGGVATWFGDNSRYFAVFDYVKTTSVITSPYVRARGTGNPMYYPPVFDPPLDTIPAGTLVDVMYEGAPKNNGKNGTGFDPDIAQADGQRHVAFQVRFEGNATTFLSPNFNTVVIPFLRQ